MSFGVQKIDEYTIVNGRALVITENIETSISDIKWGLIADGTIHIDPETGDIKYKNKSDNIDAATGAKKWYNFSPTNIFQSNTISSELLLDKTITAIKMGDNSVATRNIINKNITTEKIADQAIITSHFEANSLFGTVIADETIDGMKLKPNNVNGNRVLDRTITNTKIASKAITSAELSDSCITTNQIKDGAITSDKILDASVVEFKISDDAVTSTKIKNLSVVHSKIGLKAVDFSNINDAAIRAINLEDGCITNTKINDGSVTTDKIADTAITSAKIAPSSISETHIVNGAVTLNKLESTTKTIISNAVVHVNSVARVYGTLQVDANIAATQANYTQQITGFTIVNKTADFAEAFITSEPMEEGEIAEIDNYGCVKKASETSRKVIGVVSKRYGICFDVEGDELETGAKTAIGLIGKLPVKIIGQVNAGDFIVSAGNGIGMAVTSYIPGCIVGKALEDKKSEELGFVFCLIQVL
jgi:hypothetical protein